jgi:hypothetical protein
VSRIERRHLADQVVVSRARPTVLQAHRHTYQTGRTNDWRQQADTYPHPVHQGVFGCVVKFAALADVSEGPSSGPLTVLDWRSSGR